MKRGETLSIRKRPFWLWALWIELRRSSDGEFTYNKQPIKFFDHVVSHRATANVHYIFCGEYCLIFAKRRLSTIP